MNSVIHVYLVAGGTNLQKWKKKKQACISQDKPSAEKLVTEHCIEKLPRYPLVKGEGIVCLRVSLLLEGCKDIQRTREPFCILFEPRGCLASSALPNNLLPGLGYTRKPFDHDRYLIDLISDVRPESRDCCDGHPPCPKTTNIESNTHPPLFRFTIDLTAMDQIITTSPTPSPRVTYYGRQGFQLAGSVPVPLTGSMPFVYKLPFELLSEIFSLSCTTLELPCPAGTIIPQIVLGQVCSNWRQVACGTTKLWADVSFDFSETPDSLRMMELASEVLRRSGTVPLSLVIVTSHPRPNPVPILVIPHLHHTQNLALTIPAPYYAPFYALPPGLTDVLESLSFDFVLNNGPYPYTTPPTVLSIAPRLNKVSMQALFGLYDRDNPLVYRGRPLVYRASDGLAFTETIFYDITAGLNFAQLTTLLLPTTCLSAASCHTILKRCPNLVDCEFDITDADDPIDETLFVMPMLRFLKVEKYLEQYGILGGFFSPLVLPSLEDFVFHTHGPDEDDWPAHDFISLLERSHCQLVNLDISWQNIEEDHILAILRLMPCLKTLGIAQSESVFEEFFDTLATQGDQLIPNLECIELRVDGEGPGDDPELYEPNPAAIVRMLQARWASPLSKLKTAVLCFWQPYPDLILILEDLKSQGFDIRIS